MFRLNLSFAFDFTCDRHDETVQQSQECEAQTTAHTHLEKEPIVVDTALLAVPDKIKRFSVRSGLALTKQVTSVNVCVCVSCVGRAGAGEAAALFQKDRRIAQMMLQ